MSVGLEHGAANTPRRVHVLFVHGVGRHSRLSSLLQAYQSLRANIKSPEAPIEFEDLFSSWKLRDFNDGSHPASLRLEPQRRNADTGEDRDIYLYEVNYSALAGVIRDNHRLDIAHLFISLDLAVNVSRNRLRAAFSKSLTSDAAERKRHLALAGIAQRLAGVLVAGTVPILGLPSLLLRRYIGTFVADFTRFFEDVATFALDRNGESLISAHVDHAIQSIEVKRTGDPLTSDEFVIVAHSLGTIVTHSFLVRHWEDDKVPDRVVTLGSPIGLVCWLWRFLDFTGLRFDPKGTNEDPYFCWKPMKAPTGSGRTIDWINVVNHLDPIATAFPMGDIYLAMDEQQIAARLAGGKVRNHFIKTGGLLSIGAAHTEYFDDKKNFLELLGKSISMRPNTTSFPASRKADSHWLEAGAHLFSWQVGMWLAGLGLLVGYFAWLSHYCGSPMPWALMTLYAWPPFTMGWLAFFQRLLLGGPTKRTRAKTIRGLPLFDRSSFPYRLRQILGFGRSDPAFDARAPNLAWKYFLHVVSFIPTFIAMVLPIWWMAFINGAEYGLRQFIQETMSLGLLFVGLFMLYTMTFAVSEFARHWRGGLKSLDLLTHYP